MSQVVTTPQQSKSLLLAGLNPNTADFYWEFRHFWYVGEAFKDRTDENLTYLHYREECTWRKNNIPKDDDMIFDEGQCASFKFIPAWSLSKLWDINNDSGLAPHNYGGDDFDSTQLIETLVRWIREGLADGEVADEYLALPPNI